jgi:hypothetical protein
VCANVVVFLAVVAAAQMRAKMELKLLRMMATVAMVLQLS